MSWTMQPLSENEVHQFEDLVTELPFSGCAINANIDDVEAFAGHSKANFQFMQYIESIDFDFIYSQIINGNRVIILELLN